MADFGQAGLSIKNITKKYGPLQVLHGIDLEVNSGEFCVFVGPSGCGKSTLLRMIAGLEDVTSGEIEINGRPVANLEPAARGVAMVFQSYALYPHMTVEQNMGFGLELAGMRKPQIRERVHHAADILRLTDYLKRRPRALSGGQRQRVAIGRAIVREPEIFLLDEPLSNLDAELRSDMRFEIAQLHNQLGVTMVYVTHDQVEAMTLADKIVVMNKGLVEQIGTPMELYKTPKTRFVAGFIGSPKMNFVPGEMLDMGQVPEIGIRPEHIKMSTTEGAWKANVQLVEGLGGESLVHTKLENGIPIVVKVTGDASIEIGDTAWLTPDHSLLHRFNQDGLAI